MVDFVATYRLQFTPSFGFAEAAALAPYFADLGISHIYASPIQAARAGSTHGYDGTDPTLIREELGGATGFEGMAATLRGHGIGILLDIVPNHLAADAANPYWMKTLAFGRAAPSAAMFDIDWSRKLALPWLGDDGLATTVLCFDPVWGAVADVAGRPAPLRPRSVAALVELVGGDGARWRSLDEGGVEAERLAAARVGLAKFGVSPGTPLAIGPAALSAILDDQHWRLVPWHTFDAINYRRFFDVTDLVGVRVEDEAVFDLIHRLPLALLGDGLVDGFRVDHIDGLADPAAYCGRLRAAAGPEAILLLEKILAPGEALPDWPIDGTTGYERLVALNELFVDGDGRTRLAAAMPHEREDLSDPAGRIVATKAEVLRSSFTPELDRLVGLARPFAGGAWEAKIREALVALLSAFPVYRSYIAALPASAADLGIWHEAERSAASRKPEQAVLVHHLVEAVLADETGAEFRRRFQQLSGPAMAKGVEDTELYRNVALIGLNEVGARPGAPLASPDDVEALFRATGPRALTPLATHDTKRGADGRARLAALSWFAEDWIGEAARWQTAHAGLKPRIGDRPVPDATDEWYLYQLLFSAWPITRERMGVHLCKAVREAKRHGSWLEPDTAYEDGFIAFAAMLLEAPAGAGFRDAMAAFVSRIESSAQRISLSQVALQMLLPGVSDLYQGTEGWDFSLVDPDNRRPVDWDRLQAMAAAPQALGVVKQALISRLLAFRRGWPGLAEASLRRRRTQGDDWLAFHRGWNEAELIVATPISRAAAGGEVQITLADDRLDGIWTDVLQGQTVRIRAGRIASPDALLLPVLVRSAGT